MKGDHKKAYSEARLVLDSCLTKIGFVASPTKRYNYYRVFARDGVIMGLAAILTKDKKLIKGFLKTLATLKNNQGLYGQIPSNVGLKKNEVSYGRTTGRVDASLWFVVGCGQYYRHTKDKKFLKDFSDALDKVMNFLGSIEYNQKGFVYVPPTGDWADEYIQNGYVLYDQIFYFKALQEYAFLLKSQRRSDKYYIKKYQKLQNLIQANFWLRGDCDNKFVYHSGLLDSGKRNYKSKESYWLPAFSPLGYQYHFDSMANVFASLFGIASSDQSSKTDEYILKNFSTDTKYLLPSFSPVITKQDANWQKLQSAYSFKFKNNEYEYLNGGLWTFITAFYVADLVKRNKKEIALNYLKGIDVANAKSKTGGWGFYEFLHGKNFKPMGTCAQGWSAAATIISHEVLLNDKTLFV